MKKNIFLLKRKAEVNYERSKVFRPMVRISLPSFPFESTVESASNRIIDVRGLIKVLKRHSTFYLFKFIAKV
jgi:hypothetical protein